MKEAYEALFDKWITEGHKLSPQEYENYCIALRFLWSQLPEEDKRAWQELD